MTQTGGLRLLSHPDTETETLSLSAAHKKKEHINDRQKSILEKNMCNNCGNRLCVERRRSKNSLQPDWLSKKKNSVNNRNKPQLSGQTTPETTE